MLGCRFEYLDNMGCLRGGLEHLGLYRHQVFREHDRQRDEAERGQSGLVCYEPSHLLRHMLADHLCDVVAVVTDLLKVVHHVDVDQTRSNIEFTALH